MTWFSSFLELLVLHNVLCELRFLEKGVHYTNETILVGTNETVELKCYCFDQTECVWRISTNAVPDETCIQYIEGHLLNPKLKNTNIDIIGGNKTGDCNLKIRRFSAVDEGSYSCTLWNLGPYAYYYVYNVQLTSLPSNLTIHGSIMKRGKKVVRGVEGKNLTIVCTVESGRPAATLVLSRNKVSIRKEGRDRVTYSFIPTKKENMQSIVCSAYSRFLDNPLSFEVQLDIQYSPVVEITRRPTKHQLILICNPRGNPEHYTIGDWEHWSEFKEHIKNIEGTPDGILPFLKFTNSIGLHETDGIYKCKASNGIYGTNGHLYQIGTVLVHNKVPPIFVMANKPIQFGRYGHKMNLTVLLYNKYGTIQTTISKLSEPLHTETSQESILTHDRFHGVNVTVSGIKITFQLTLDKKEDFTDYTIKACNEMGCNELTVKITSARLSYNKYDVTTMLFVLLVVIAVALVKAVWTVVLIVLAVVLAITVLTAFFLLRRKENDASDIYNPTEEEVRENFQMEPVDNQLYLSSDDPDLAHVHNLRNQNVTNTSLPSTSRDNQTYQMQLHNENGGNGRRPRTYINSGVIPSVHNRQVPRQICKLNYTEITFDEAPTMHDAAIHGTCGSVNRTIYSEIDLMADPVAPLSSSESECDENDEDDILFMHM